MKNRNVLALFCATLFTTVALVSCNKESIDEDNAPIPYAPIGGYASSDEISPSNLLVKCSFEDNIPILKMELVVEMVLMLPIKQV